MIVVLADDLSGAAELAVAAKNHGLSAEVRQGSLDPSTADLVVVNTNTRLASARIAESRVSRIAQQIREQTVDRVFKKVDSVLRGNVSVESRVLMEELGRQRTVLVPANPDKGRTIRNGEYAIGNSPLHLHEVADDLLNPLRTSQVVELLADRWHSVSQPSHLSATGFFVGDAEVVQDLDAWATVCDSNTLPVGAVEFFSAILRSAGHELKPELRLSPEPESCSLLVCGTAVGWKRRRHQLSDSGVATLLLPKEAVSDAGETEHWREKTIAALNQSRVACIAIGDMALDELADPHELVRLLGKTVADVLLQVRVDHLLLEGGATAESVVEELGITAFEATDQGSLFDPAGGGPAFYIKPGSYDWPPQLWTLLEIQR